MYVYGRNVAKELLRNNRNVKKAYLINNFNEEEIINLLEEKNIEINYVDRKHMDKMEEGNHQGIILSIDDYN